MRSLDQTLNTNNKIPDWDTLGGKSGYTAGEHAWSLKRVAREVDKMPSEYPSHTGTSRLGADHLMEAVSEVRYPPLHCEYFANCTLAGQSYYYCARQAIQYEYYGATARNHSRLAEYDLSN